MSEEEQGFLAGQSSVWLQVGGPNTKPEYLGCHEVGDVDQPAGDVTTKYCPDRRRQGEYKATGSYQGAAGPVTSTITTVVGPTADYMEQIRCLCNLFIHKSACGRRDVFSSYDRSFILRNARVAGRGVTGLASRSPEGEAESLQTFDLSAPELVRIHKLTSGRQTIGATGDLRGIHFCNSEICEGECGPAREICEYGVAVGNSPVASVMEPGEVWITQDGGMNWAESATHPFAADEDVAAVSCFETTRDTTRILVARGTADAGNPAEIAYSDDDGATWHTVNVGSVNGQYVLDSEGLFAYDMYNIWLVTNDGYIYKSEDGGLTWTAQESGTLAPAGYNAIEFVNADDGWAVGDNNAMVKTEDGGATWSVVAGPAGKAADECEALAVISALRAWIGYSDGELWYTKNGGTTWYQRGIPVAATIINDIAFYDDLVGYLTYNIAGPVGGMLRTINGGNDWEVVPGMPTNLGLDGLYVCDHNLAFAVGPVQGGTGVVIKAYAS